MSIFLIGHGSYLPGLVEADADAKPSAAVQSKAHMHQKTKKNQANRRADVDNHGKNGFTSRSITRSIPTYGDEEVGQTPNIQIFLCLK